MFGIGDVISILNFLADAVGRIQELIEKQERREKIKDELVGALLRMVDFVVDIWLELKVAKALEGGYEEQTDEIEDTIDEIRSLLQEAYRAVTADDLRTATAKLDTLERERRKLIRLLRRLRRLQRRARQGSKTGKPEPVEPGR